MRRSPSFFTLSRRRIALGLFLAAAACSGHVVWIEAKAIVAQVLLQRAWVATLEGRPNARPWPWADTYPVARLRVPRYGVDEIVLAGTTGRSLAFGPGHMDGTGRLGGPENAVVVGHRDTHFRFLRDLVSGDEILVQMTRGQWQRFEVVTIRIVHESDTSVLNDLGVPALTLITCYPFDAVVPGGPMRLVVQARLIEAGGLGSPRLAAMPVS